MPHRSSIPAPSNPVDDASFAWHIRRTFELALPIIVTRSAYLILATVDTIMTGWSGARELAYLALGTAPQIALMLVGIGAVQSVSVMTAQAVGANDPLRAGSVYRAGMVLALILGCLIMSIALAARPFFLATGQSPDLIDGAVAVTWQYAWAMPGLLMFIVCGYFLEATDRPKVGMVIMIVINLLNIPLNGLFVLGWGGLIEPMGAVGAVFTSTCLRWAGMVAAVVYIFHSAGKTGDPFGLLISGKIKTAIGEALSPIGANLRRIGIPMGLAQGIESGAFSALMLIAGRIGASALAAHQVTQSLISLVFMVAIGTMAATAIRVGNAAGRGDPLGVRRAGWTGIGIGGTLAILPTLAFFLVPEWLVYIFTDDPAVLAFATTMVFIAGLMLCVDAMMAVSIGAVRGLGDVWPALFIQVGAFWLVAVPVAAYLCLVANIGPTGLIWALLIGVILSFCGLASRFWVISHRRITAL